MSEIPKTHKSYACVEKGKATVTSKPIPQVDAGGILVKVKAVALNPTDWKHLDRLMDPGQSVGSDFAGTVVAVGPEAGDLIKVGDDVAGYLRGGFAFDDRDNAAFQEYVRTYPELVYKKPAGTSYEEAAALSLAAATAAQALYVHLGIPKPWATASPSGPPILIWSGATSVGDAAIQIAALSGLPVITTSSPQHFQRLKSIGASEVFDYKEEGVSEKIKAATGGKLGWGLDTISEKGSTLAAAKCYGEKGGKVITLLPVKPEDYPDWPANVTPEHTLIYSALRKSERDTAALAEWYAHLPQYIQEGKIKAQPLKVFEGGLSGLDEAMEYVRSGKVKGEKVVLKIE